jgi:hypothetical protein
LAVWRLPRHLGLRGLWPTSTCAQDNKLRLQSTLTDADLLELRHMTSLQEIILKDSLKITGRGAV